MRGERRGRILIVEPDADARAALVAFLDAAGFEVEAAADGFKALGKLDRFDAEVVVTRLELPGLDGLGLVARVRARPAAPAVIVRDPRDAAAPAIAALEAGARTYLVASADPGPLVTAVAAAVFDHRAAAAAHRPATIERGRHGMIGRSPAMRELYAAIDRVGPARASVLLTGETGTGKELVAAALHAVSPRAAGPLVRVHCAALTESLLESELFGHERGAFTGAIARREGRLAAAHGGTLFLDEIGEISPALQIKLLRFLQEHEFERVGGDGPIHVDVRVIAATHRDLGAAVAAGAFREDLFYRLNVVALETPPLRERVGDIPLLAQHFFEHAIAASARPMVAISAGAMRALLAHPWPGNVRELEHAIERAVVLGTDRELRAEDLPPSVRGPGGRDGIAIPGSSLHAIERHAILKTLEATGGSTSKAAAILEITARTIQYKLQAYRRDASGGHVGASSDE